VTDQPFVVLPLIFKSPSTDRGGIIPDHTRGGCYVFTVMVNGGGQSGEIQESERFRLTNQNIYTKLGI